MLTLAVDTTAKTASAALLRDENILGHFFLDTGLVHSKTLVPLIQTLLEKTGTDTGEIDLFAVANGPGSFTGIRIGVAAVKGMAYAAGKPCAGVSTLDVIAENLAHLDGAVICAVMDARCNQVYNALYDCAGGALQKRASDRALMIDELAAELECEEKPVFFVGDGGDLCYNTIKQKLKHPKLAPPHLLFQNAAGVGFCGIRAFAAGEAVSANDLRPVYLRVPQAERERQLKINSKQ